MLYKTLATKKILLCVGGHGSRAKQFKDLQLKESKRILSFSEDLIP